MLCFFCAGRPHGTRLRAPLEAALKLAGSEAAQQLQGSAHVGMQLAGGLVTPRLQLGWSRDGGAMRSVPSRATSTWHTGGEVELRVGERPRRRVAVPLMGCCGRCAGVGG